MKSRCLACELALVLIASGCKSGPDDSFLDVVLTVPEAGDVSVPIETRIGFRVDAPLDASSLTTETFFLTDDQGEVVPSTVTVGEEADTAELSPGEPLAVTTTFTVTITTGLLSSDGETLEEDFTWSFTTLDSAWGQDEWLEEIGTGNSLQPEIASDGQRNAIVVWQYDETDSSSIYASRYTRTDLWSDPVLIDDGSGNAINPRLAVDEAGYGFVVWEQESDDGSTQSIWSNRYVVDEGWGTPEIIQNEQTTFGRSPSVAADPAGNAIAVWIQIDPDTGNRVTWANRYEVGSGWGTAEAIDDMPTLLSATRTNVDMDDAGNAIAVWRRPTSGGDVLLANRYVAGSGWGTAELIEADADSSATSPRLDVGPGGDAFVIWVQPEDTRLDVWATRFSGNSWETPVRIDIHDAGDKQQPDITVDGMGVAHAVWSQVDPDFANIWAAQYSPGSGWGAPDLIEPPNEDPRRDTDATDPRVDCNAAGNTFVVWRQNLENWSSVWSNHLDPGVGWMTAETIEMRDRPALAPIVTVDDARHAHAVWPHSESLQSGNWLRTNRFE